MAAAFRLQHAIKFSKYLSRTVSRSYKNFPVDREIRTFPVFCRDSRRLLASQAEPKKSEENDYHSIIKPTEQSKGAGAQHQFQSETRMLLEIVAKSLYSDKEVFVRELISNASDALEKRRYLRVTDPQAAERGDEKSLEIHIATDKQNRLLIIQDTGVGMTREELISNLGTIARSGSKAFMEQLKEKNETVDRSDIIGQFGVGFYSAFMVADKVEVYTKSFVQDAEGLKWSYDGSGAYEISEAEGVQVGTKIILHLRNDCREFSDDAVINGIITKYSNFVGSPIFVNGKRANIVQPLWTLDPKKVTAEQHQEFYRFIGNHDTPKFILHYSTDVPLSIKALLYFPSDKPALFEMSRDTSIGISLYSRKVLITSKADNILPKWLRFVKGVVDSEDIPLNLSRELLQNSALITKVRNVLTTRILRFLQKQSTKKPVEFMEFYKHYGLFFKEGIVTGEDQAEKEEIAKLLRFESSLREPGKLISLLEYVQDLPAHRKDIFYLAAPSRALAEQSPYYETFKKRNIEVLFCYEPYDELVLMQLEKFQKKFLSSVEKEMRQDDESKDDEFPSINREEIDKLLAHMKKILDKQAYEIKTTKHLESHPCVITVQDMSSARHFVRTQSHHLNNENRYLLLQPRLEINPNHPIIKKLAKLIDTDPKLAELLTKQLFTGAMIGAGLVEDPRLLLTTINELLIAALEKH